jgi:hypothetical protein
VKPVTSLLKNDTKLNWSSRCNEAFEQLKVLLTTAPVLAQPDIEKPFDVYCDASGSGLGCVLMQEGCWGLVLKCYELRTRQHRMLNVNALRPLKHYSLKGLMNFGRRLK